jgi:molybdopterin synthase catalytic subunit
MELLKCIIEGPIPGNLLDLLVMQDMAHHQAGAVATFLGRVRADHIEGKTVSGIDYSAYAEMVEPVAESIKEQLFAEYSDLMSVYIFHSIGFVKSGESSLLVTVTSGHRKHSFAALEKCVELIKEKLPVWKKEHFTDGTSRWIE